MKNSGINDAVFTAGTEQAEVRFPETHDGGVRIQKRIGHLLGRVAYHGFVGLFLAGVLIFIAWAEKFFQPPYSSVLVPVAWLMLTAAYTYWRISAEGAPKRKKPALGYGCWPFLRETGNFIVPGCVLGACFAAVFEHFVEAFVVGGAIFGLTLHIYLYKRTLRYNELLTEKNEQEIEKWVASGNDEERSRRRAYVESGALLIGAAAAGVAEYEGAPRLRWPSAPSFASGCCDDDGSAGEDENDNSTFGTSKHFNPATGLPTVDDCPGSIDVGGNFWGHNSFE
jgi:hypothetical protein